MFDWFFFINKNLNKAMEIYKYNIRILLFT